MMRRRGHRTHLVAGLVTAVVLAACATNDKAPAPSSVSAPEEPASPAASGAPEAPPPVAAPTTPQLDPNITPPATATAAAPNQRPAATPAPSPKPVVPESTPPPHANEKKIAVHASNRYACTGGEKRDSILAAPEPHGARITITGQGPCPGEVHDWAAEVSERRVDVHATHGAPAKCKCSGSGDLVLRGLDPGTYDVHVNGGYDRPIATKVVVPP